MTSPVFERSDSDRLMAPEIQPPLKLTLEDRTPRTRWLLVGFATLLACGSITWAINSSNPKINAATFMQTLIQPTAPVATSTPIPGAYTATLQIDPPEPHTPNGIITLTGTLLLDNKPVEGAKMHLSMRYWGAGRDVDGGLTSPDGVAATTYNIGRARGLWDIRVVASFFIDDKVVTRAENTFIPTP